MSCVCKEIKTDMAKCVRKNSTFAVSRESYKKQIQGIF